jgi:hypothetical protein
MQKIQIANAHVVVEFDQLKLAINGWVNELHEYAVPRKIITIVPAAAISHRFGVLDGVAKCDLQVRYCGRASLRSENGSYCSSLTTVTMSRADG